MIWYRKHGRAYIALRACAYSLLLVGALGAVSNAVASSDPSHIAYLSIGTVIGATLFRW